MFSISCFHCTHFKLEVKKFILDVFLKLEVNFLVEVNFLLEVQEKKYSEKITKKKLYVFLCTCQNKVCFFLSFAPNRGFLILNTFLLWWL